jgi:hypothetical protein
VNATLSVSTAGVPEALRKEGSDALSSKNLERIRAEYIEMPGLVLTVSQAARLMGITPRQSERPATGRSAIGGNEE